MMTKVKFYKPQESLLPFISGYMHSIYSFDNPEKPFFTPKGTAAIGITLQFGANSYIAYPDPADKFYFYRNAPLLFGQMTKIGNSFMDERFEALVIVFTPTGLFHFMDGPASQMTDRILRLKDIGLNAMEERFNQVVKSSNEPKEWVKGLDEILSDHFFSRPMKQVSFDMEAMIREIIMLKGNLVLDEMLTKFGINKRTFQIHFKEQVGIPAKLFCRIIRFNALIDDLNTTPNRDILSRALDFGYSDKSHLYKDFKAFLGMTPKSYLKSYYQLNGLTEGVLNKNRLSKEKDKYN